MSLALRFGDSLKLQRLRSIKHFFWWLEWKCVQDQKKNTLIEKLYLYYKAQHFFGIYPCIFISGIDPLSTEYERDLNQVPPMAGWLAGTWTTLQLVPLRFCTHHPLLSAGHLLCEDRAPNTVPFDGNQVSLSWPREICWTSIHQNRCA